MTKTIYEKMVAAGVEIDHHESDLYVPVNDVTKAIVAEYKFKGIVTSFASAFDGTRWYDIPFAYSPHYERKKKIKAVD